MLQFAYAFECKVCSVVTKILQGFSLKCDFLGINIHIQVTFSAWNFDCHGNST